MFKKSLFIFGLLVVLFQFSLKTEGSSAQIIDFDSYFPKDPELIEEDLMVHMPNDFIELMKNFSSNSQELNNLIDHINMGYTFAPMNDVYIAVKQAMDSCNVNSHSYEILKNYQQAFLNGDVFISAKEIDNRKARLGRFCTLSARDCASTSILNVKNDSSICGNLCVGGTVSACNFSFIGAGCTGCTQISTLPNILSCGNVEFNTSSGTNTLNVQGSAEANTRFIRGNISLILGAGITLSSIGPDSAIVVTGLPLALANAGAGYSIGSGGVTGLGSSSGIQGLTANSTGFDMPTEFYFAVNLQIPINFATGYSAIPAILVNLQSVGITTLTDENTVTTVNLAVSNVMEDSSVINLLFYVNAQSTGINSVVSYGTALLNAQTAINKILATGLSINFMSDGQVA